jgi:hypothetical protein
MSDTFDPYDENDTFDAASLNDRFSSFKDRINALPTASSNKGALGPQHVSGIVSPTYTVVSVLTPKNAKEGTYTTQGTSSPSYYHDEEFFCDPITNGYPGYLVEDFETGQQVCWKRIEDSTGGSGVVGPSGAPKLSVNLSGNGITVGDNYNSLLVMSNVELVRATIPFGDNEVETFNYANTLVTIISTVSSTGTRTFHWETLRVSTLPSAAQYVAGISSIDIAHRLLITKPDFNVKTIDVLAATGNDRQGAPASTPFSRRTYVRFCQLTAVALHSKVGS